MSAQQKFHRIGEQRRYVFADVSCLAAQCWDPCVVVDLDTKKDVGCCRTRMHSGCPEDAARQYSTGTAHRRSQQGWRPDRDE